MQELHNGTLFQANLFDETAGQQGYFTFLHKWLIITEARALSSVESCIQNISNVAVLSWQEKAIQMVWLLHLRPLHVW